jgi:hypothetical protein
MRHESTIYYEARIHDLLWGTDPRTSRHELCRITFCHWWHNVEEYGTNVCATNDNIIRRLNFACWITNATHTQTHTHTYTHIEYVLLIAFPRQQWLHELSSMLRLFVHCLLCLCCMYRLQLPSRYKATRLNQDVREAPTSNYVKGCHMHIYRNFDTLCFARQCVYAFYATVTLNNTLCSMWSRKWSSTFIANKRHGG